MALMAVVYSRKNLLGNFGSVCFLEKLFLLDLVKQLPSIAQLGNQEVPAVTLEEFIKLKNVGVVQRLKDADFVYQFFLPFFV